MSNSPRGFNVLLPEPEAFPLFLFLLLSVCVFVFLYLSSGRNVFKISYILGSNLPYFQLGCIKYLVPPTQVSDKMDSNIMQ